MLSDVQVDGNGNHYKYDSKNDAYYVAYDKNGEIWFNKFNGIKCGLKIYLYDTNLTEEEIKQIGENIEDVSSHKAQVLVPGTDHDTFINYPVLFAVINSAMIALALIWRVITETLRMIFNRWC